MECLLYYGATVKQSGALQLAVAHDWIEGMKILVEHGADVNEVLMVRGPNSSWDTLCSPGVSTLDHAVYYQRKEAVEWLLAHGSGYNQHGVYEAAIWRAESLGRRDLENLIEIYLHGRRKPEVNTFVERTSSSILKATREQEKVHKKFPKVVLIVVSNPSLERKRKMGVRRMEMRETKLLMRLRIIR